MPAQGSAAQEGPGVSAGTAFFFFSYKSLWSECQDLGARGLTLVYRGN